MPKKPSSGYRGGTCEWKYDEYHYAWDTKCDEKFQFTFEGPEKNGFRFCPFCGGRIKVVKKS